MFELIKIYNQTILQTAILQHRIDVVKYLITLRDFDITSPIDITIYCFIIILLLNLQKFLDIMILPIF